MNLESLSWTQCGLILCALGSIAYFYSQRRVIADRAGAILMTAAIVAVVILCILVSAIVAAVAIVAVRRDRKRHFFVCTSEQLHATAALERRFEAIRRERGIDRHGRLLPLPREPRDVAPEDVVDLRKYSIRRQAL